MASCQMSPRASDLRVLKTILLVLALLLGAATEALAQGTISGTVSSSTTGLGLPNGEVHFYELDGATGVERRITTTDGLGNYTINLPPGTYGFLTQNKQGYINEIFDNIPCSAVCDVESLTPVIVTNGSARVANFILDPGGRIAGRVTDSTTGLGIEGALIYFVPQTGDVPFSFATSDATGNYISDGGTAAGTVFAATFAPGYRSEAWDDIKCADCDITQVGTPMTVAGTGTTGGFDFALDPGGTVSGTVRDANLVPLANVELKITDALGDQVEFAITDVSGNFTSGGLLTGTYYVITENAYGLVDEVWNNIPCLNANCDPTRGAPIAVTLGADTGGIDFVLQPGGAITGTITNGATGLPIPDNVFVQIFDPSGTFIGGASTNDVTSQYRVRAVAPGTYYASVGYTGFFNQIYNGVTCPLNCPVTQGTPIHVTVGVTTANINFALVPATSVGSISGTIRDITGVPAVVASLNVQLFSTFGQVIANVNTNASGVYTFSNLAAASYYVRTNGTGALINELHNNVVCINCSVTSSGGTPVPVTAGGTAVIDFDLVQGGRISGTVTNAVGGGVLSGIAVQLFSATGVAMGQSSTNASGVYTTRGLPDGTYYLRTSDPLGFFVNKLYNSINCPGTGCAPTTGTPVVGAGTATVGGRDFAISSGGRISGNVSGPAGMQLQFAVQVQVYTEAGALLGNSNLDASGNYATFALPAGKYFLRTANSIGLTDEVYDNLPCPGLCTVTSGTGVDVVVGATASGRNFVLTAGGNIAGTVRDAGTSLPLAQVRVFAVLADGTVVKTAATNANGEYAILGLQAGTYYVRTSIIGGAFYLDELFPELPCSPTCTVTDGTPIVVTPGVTEGGKNFTLAAGGGALSGTVREAGTNAPLVGMRVDVFLADGTPVKGVGSGVAGAFVVSLPAGSYRVRTTAVGGTYLDELFNEMPCSPTCNVAGGAAVVVADAATTGSVDFTLSPNLVRNGRFETATSNWQQFATPDMSDIVSQVTGGVFEYYRVAPPPGTANQAVIFQTTGVALPADAPLVARFSLGNSSTVKKRISVLVLDSDFSDLAECTFWIQASTSLTPYQMRTHTTKAWANAAIYFYAASAGSNGGFYQLDEVSLEYVPTESAFETNCVDPTAPAASSEPAGSEMLGNGNFDTGALPPWNALFNITWQVTGGVFEFIRVSNPGTTNGVLVQATGQPIAANTILTATFQLGNSSSVRKRVTVILHDSNFSDLSACTFWLAPGQPLSDYTYRTFATQAWANATLSVYPATTGADQWIRLDNVTFRRTPATSIVGTECVEPGGSLAPSVTAVGAAGNAGMAGATTGVLQDSERGGRLRESGGSGHEWRAVASASGHPVLQRSTPLDLTTATSASLAFRSWLSASASWGEVQVRGKDGEWTTVLVIYGSDAWSPIAIDLSAYLGEVVDVRFVFRPAGGEGVSENWQVGAIQVEIKR